MKIHDICWILMIILLGHLLNSMDEELMYHLSAKLGCDVLYYFARLLIALTCLVINRSIWEMNILSLPWRWGLLSGWTAGQTAPISVIGTDNQCSHCSLLSHQWKLLVEFSHFLMLDYCETVHIFALCSLNLLILSELQPGSTVFRQTWSEFSLKKPDACHQSIFLSALFLPIKNWSV